MASTGAKIQDELWKLRLNLLQEKLKRKKERVKSYGQQLDSSSDMDNGHWGSPRDSHLDREMRLARQRQQELRDLIAQERMLHQFRGPPPAWPERAPEPPKTAQDSPKSKDRFEQVMEMMMLQHQQTQNMIMNQMLIGNNKNQPQVMQQPPPFSLPPIYPPYPYVYHQYGYPMPPPPELRPSTPPSSPPRTQRRPQKPRPHTSFYAFPGNESQRKIRQLGYAAIFCSHLQKQAKRNNFRPNVKFLFELKLKEIVSALHRIYLAPEGKIYQLLRSSIFEEASPDYAILIEPKIKITVEEQKQTTQALSLAIETIVYNITEIMPAKGVLGTHRKSLVFDLVRSDQKFPDDYFYNIEKEIITVSSDNTTMNVTDEDAAVLFSGVYLDRALIQSLLAKPVNYRLTTTLDVKSESNIRVIASILFYIYRRVIANLSAFKRGLKRGTKITVPPVPVELLNWLYSDEVLLRLIKKMKKSVDYAEDLILPWCQEYVSRVRNSAF